jgi:23S rRNA pseudouridine955/2504/2580 synthase
MPRASTFTVDAAEDGHKLLQILERRLGKAAPRSAMMRWIRTGQVRVDGGRVKPFVRLAAGQVVRVPPYQTHDTSATPAKALPLDVVHEDAELLVVNKPSGLPTQPGSGHADSLQTRIAARHAGDPFTPAAVHRLDKFTSGLVVAGKTYKALRRLSELFAAGGADKRYLAWVEGAFPDEGWVTMRDHLAKRRRGRNEVVETGSGREALARARVLEHRGENTLLLLELGTGRTHQLRVQLAERGHPIVGDVKYGRPHPVGRMLLHAWCIALPEGAFRADPDWPAPFAVDARMCDQASRLTG